MKRYLQATLMVCGGLFVVLFGIAILPILVAMVGSVAGVLLAFAPAVIVVAIIAIVAHFLRDDR